MVRHNNLTGRGSPVKNENGKVITHQWTPNNKAKPNLITIIKKKDYYSVLKALEHPHFGQGQHYSLEDAQHPLDLDLTKVVEWLESHGWEVEWMEDGRIVAKMPGPLRFGS